MRGRSWPYCVVAVLPPETAVAALRQTRAVSMFEEMFEDRSYQRSFYSAQQSLTSRLAALLFSVDHAAAGTGKVNAFVNRRARSSDHLVNPPAGQRPLPTETRGRVTKLGLGAIWTHARNWRVACNLSSNDRNRQASQPITLTRHGAWDVKCPAQFVVQ